MITHLAKVLCTIADAQLLSTQIACPSDDWAWSVTKDNITGSVYWKDQQGCQGVWNVIDLTSAQFITLQGMWFNVVVMQLLFMVNIL